MHASPLVALLVTAACATPARPISAPPANVESIGRYTLLPLYVRGSEGRHSASHSSTIVGGELRVIGERAELDLSFDHVVGFVRCPAGRPMTMQACAPRDAEDSRTTSRRVLRGSARTENGTLRLTVAAETDRMTIACSESFLGLACAIEETTMFGVGVIAPHTMAFVSPGTKRFTIAPTAVKDVGSVTGTLALEGNGTLAMTLALDGGAPTTLPGGATWQDHGISLRAETSPTRNLGARCTVDGDRLACDVTGDRSILGKPEHIYGQMLLVPDRT